MLDEARWQQEVLRGLHATDKVAGLAFLSVPQGGRNLLANGGFEDWNVAGTGPWDAPVPPAAQRYFDGWFATGATALTQTSAITDGSRYAVQGVFQSGGFLVQTLNNAAEYRGRTLTLAVRGFGDWFYCGLIDDTGADAVSQLTNGGLGVFATAACSLRVSPAATVVTALIIPYPSGTGATYVFDNIMLTAYAAPVPYQATQPALANWRERGGYWTLPFHCRWRTQAAGEATVYSLPLPYTPRMPQILASAFYASQGALGDNNIDIDPAKTYAQVADNRTITVQVTGVFAALDTYVRGGYVTITTD